MEKMIFAIILIPLLAGASELLMFRGLRIVKEAVVLVACAINLYIAWLLFSLNSGTAGAVTITLPWASFGMDFSLRLAHFSSFILLATAFFGLAIAIYSASFMHKKSIANQFYAYVLISIGFVNGAVLSNNLVLMLFFWEGLLVTLFGLISLGGKASFKTATKAFIIIGVSDLCMMVGMAITAHLAGTLTISDIHLQASGLGALAFVLLMIGAIAKAGAMPFHSWIPDAAQAAPLPFMAILPASLEKLLGIYFLTRISLDMFKLEPTSWLSTLMMIVGAITILLAVMMALVQKEYKKLLSFHAISQVGYMILGIGTCLPVGIVGGIFHMVNNALYKSCLFLTGGSVEKQAGTTDLDKLGGLASKMPITFICFIVAAVSISGVPPFNGFFSKELIYDAALERNIIYYIAAILGSFFTAASFLKLGHAAFLGKKNENAGAVKEASIFMLLPMIAIAAICVLFGVWNQLPLEKLIQPILSAEQLAGHHFSGMPANFTLILVTVICLVGAFLHHIYGVKLGGSGLKAAEHIRRASFIGGLYDRAEKRFFDPYEIGLTIVRGFSWLMWFVDRKIDWIYDGLSVRVSGGVSYILKRAHTGSYAVYIVWSLVGAFVAVLYLMK